MRRTRLSATRTRPERGSTRRFETSLNNTVRIVNYLLYFYVGFLSAPFHVGVNGIPQGPQRFHPTSVRVPYRSLSDRLIGALHTDARA